MMLEKGCTSCCHDIHQTVLNAGGTMKYAARQYRVLRARRDQYNVTASPLEIVPIPLGLEKSMTMNALWKVRPASAG